MRAICIGLVIIFVQTHEMIQAASLPTIKYAIPKKPQPEDRAVTKQLEARLHTKSGPFQCSSGDIEDYTVKNGLISSESKWEIFNIYIGPEYTDDERTLINNAAYRLSQVIPCVDFRIWDEEDLSEYKGTYINIMKTGGGCWSYTGKSFEGAQNMSLDNGCLHVHTIMHEMIHALGFRHEHSRPDRDDYITIYMENVKPGQEHNFRKYSYDEVTTFNVPYNLKSIMQYHSYGFSGNKKPTMLTKKGELIAKPKELHESDKIKLQRMYECS